MIFRRDSFALIKFATKGEGKEERKREIKAREGRDRGRPSAREQKDKENGMKVLDSCKDRKRERN